MISKSDFILYADLLALCVVHWRIMLIGLDALSDLAPTAREIVAQSGDCAP